MERKQGTIFTSHVTKSGVVVRYKVVDVAEGNKTYGFGYKLAKGTLIVRRVRKDNTMTGKRKTWAG